MAVTLAVIEVSFVLLTQRPARTAYAHQCLNDVATLDALTPQFVQSFNGGAGPSARAVRTVVVAVKNADRRLSSQHWPRGLQSDIDALVSSNRAGVHTFISYTSATAVERNAILGSYTTSVARATYFGSLIRSTLHLPSAQAS